MPDATPPDPVPDDGPAGDALLARVRALVAAAEANGPGAVPALRAFLDATPAVLSALGTMAELADRHAADLVGTDPLSRELARREADGVRDALAGDDPTGVERILADHAGTCWLADRGAQMQVSRAGAPTAALSRAAEASQRRLLTAVKTLTLVRAAVAKAGPVRPPLKLFDPARKTGT